MLFYVSKLFLMVALAPILLKEIKMSSKLSWVGALIVVITLAACGGGGGGGTPSSVDPTNTGNAGGATTAGGTNNPVVSDLVACLDLNPVNSFSWDAKASPASYSVVITSTVSGSAPSPTTVGSTTTTVVATPTTPVVVTSTSVTFYPDSSAVVSYRNDTFQGSTVRAAKTKGFNNYYFGINGALSSRVAFDNDVFSTISPTSVTFVGSLSYNTAGQVISQGTTVGRSRSLTLQPGQSQNYVYATSFTNGVSTTITSSSAGSETYTFVAKEDVATTAGTFKNACKVQVDRVSSTAVNTGQLNKALFTVWYVPGWGVVKETALFTYTDGRSPNTMTLTTQATNIVSGTLP
jgi:hypothetical protein